MTHKFDPMSQQDYYQMRAVFTGVQHGDREVRPPDADERMAKAEGIKEELNDIEAALTAFLPLASTRLTYVDDDGPLFQESGTPSVSLLKRPTGTKTVGKLNGEDSDEKTTYWKSRAGEPVFSWNPDQVGKRAIWVSWVAGDGAHAEQAIYVLDRDGDLATADDQITIAEVNQKLLADQKDGMSPERLWSGFHYTGVHDLNVASRVFVRSGKDFQHLTADIIALKSVTSDEEPATPDRPRFRRPPTPLLNVERFAPIEAKALRMVVTESVNNRVCIDELEVFASGETPTNVALAERGAVPSASSAMSPNEKHKTIHLNDGVYGNSNSWIPGEDGEAWARIDFPEPVTIDRIAWARDRKGEFSDRLASVYRVEVGLDGETWTTVAGSHDRLAVGTVVKDDSLYTASGTTDAERGALTTLLAKKSAKAAEHKKLVTFPMIYGGSFTEPEPTHFLYRGDPMEERDPVGPGRIARIAPALDMAEDEPEQERRKKLATWIASPENPLTARVMVNRIWQHHFGHGLVDTPSDFGAMGVRPTHPELLDWLAITFMDDEWRPKAIHRTILMSRTYRQASTPHTEAMAIDADCRYLWRFPPRRLEAEPIRDSILHASGVIDLAMGGPGYHVFKFNDNYVRVYDPKTEFGPAEWRRMVYQYKPRMEQDETFGIFDCPDGAQRQPRRTTSTTPLQALNLLNSPFMMQQADLFAKRLQKGRGRRCSSAGGAGVFTAVFTRGDRGRTGGIRKAHFRPRTRSVLPRLV